MRCPTRHPSWCARVKAVSDIPVGVGLGVRSREQAAQIGAYADGVIVGSALVSALDGGHPRRAGADRRTGRRCAAEDFGVTTTVLASFPSPSQGVWHLGPIPLRAYALFIIVGIIAALVIGDRRWTERGGEPGVIFDIALWAITFGLVGGRLYHVLTDWITYFGAGGAGLVAALQDPGGWPRHLGCGRARWRRRVDRVSAQGHSVARLRRRGRARNRAGAGHRPDRQLLQPGALRQGDDDAVGSGDLRAPRSERCARLPQRGVDRAADRDRPSHVPVRIALEPAGFRAPDLGGPPLPDRSWPAVRAVRRRRTASGGSGSS